MFICFAVSSKNPSIVINSARGEAGDTVDVTITMSNNPGFVSANLYVKYDESVLTLKKVKDGGLLSGVTHSDNYTSPYGLCWVNDLSKENFKVNGVLATLTFEISKEANPGSTTISLEQDILNCDVENVVFDLISGKVEISSSSQSKDSDLPETTSKASNSDSNVNSVDDYDKASKNNESVNQSEVKDSDASDINEKSEDYDATVLSTSDLVGNTKKSSTSDSATNKGGGVVQTVSILIAVILIAAIILAAVFVYYKRTRKK
nr:cohesin domain-containing protein [Ruminococcus bromii]